MSLLCVGFVLSLGFVFFGTFPLFVCVCVVFRMSDEDVSTGVEESKGSEESRDDRSLVEEYWDRLDDDKPVDWEGLKDFLTDHPQLDRNYTLYYSHLSPPLSFIKWLVETEKGVPIIEFIDRSEAWGDYSAEFPEVLKYLLDKASPDDQQRFVSEAIMFSEFKSLRFMLQQGVQPTLAVDDPGQFLLQGTAATVSPSN